MDNSSEQYFSRMGSSKRGRHTVDDDTLALVRNDLAVLLSVWWPDIGWQLRRANSIEEICQAFEPLRGKNNDYLIARFLQPSSLKTSGSSVRCTRRSFARAVKKRYQAQDKCGEPQRYYIEAQTAVTEARPEELGKVRRELLKRQSRLLAVRNQLRSAMEMEQRLQKELAEQEISFAQEQLLQILNERRCARNPLKLANAMAGLPSLTARVSYARCSKIKYRGWPTIYFQTFQKIESIWNVRHRYRDLPLVDLYRQEIRKLPRTFRRTRTENYLRTRLAGDFGHLKSAIEKSVAANVDSDRMPFIITSNFEKNRDGPSTALTRTLAAIERID